MYKESMLDLTPWMRYCANPKEEREFSNILILEKGFDPIAMAVSGGRTHAQWHGRALRGDLDLVVLYSDEIWKESKLKVHQRRGSLIWTHNIWRPVEGWIDITRFTDNTIMSQILSSSDANLLKTANWLYVPDQDRLAPVLERLR